MYAENDLLDIAVTDHGDQTLVTLRGELDLATQGTFRTQVIDLLVSGSNRLVIDLSELDFLDSTGLGALIGIRRRAHALQGSMTLVCPTHAVMELFSIAGLEKVFDIRPSLDVALDSGVPQA
ncbi:STAS domain-containing protein [Nocardioides mesophilus]|uniref:Anti-sigma factor antagonist n=1 Tax=Nocardioides mesophilus TaxID=433659 RepID=A0A7G9RGA1_9ACTN|nr:STAS domain-containing protein [Nocardioides mesophilus]QNN54626.1 STAS domain-containing protein [Nocardioides mesophilus]